MTQKATPVFHQDVISTAVSNRQTQCSSQSLNNEISTFELFRSSRGSHLGGLRKIHIMNQSLPSLDTLKSVIQLETRGSNRRRWRAPADEKTRSKSVRSREHQLWTDRAGMNAAGRAGEVGLLFPLIKRPVPTTSRPSPSCPRRVAGIRKTGSSKLLVSQVFARSVTRSG